MQFLKTTLLLFLGLSIFSCNKDDEEQKEVIIPYSEQAPKDDLAINKFLDEYHMDVSNDFQDVEFTKITIENNLTSIKNDFEIKTKIIKIEEVDHKIYYIAFSEGSIGEKPTSVDSVYVTYKGEYIYNKKEEILPSTDPKTYKEYIASTKFEERKSPIWIGLNVVVRAWREIFPLFKPGSHVVNSDGSIIFSDFGAGLMIFPSALGYYNNTGTSIPKYSPLIFNFTLKKMNFSDNDFDGIDSRFEGYDSVKNEYILDTDGDGNKNYLDQDDDDDLYLTKNEIGTDKFNPRDTDNDGIKDYLDTDDDGDGMLTKDEKPGDEDVDGILNYLDFDTKIKR